MIRLLLSLLAVSLPASALAQDETAAPGDEIRRFTVEVIIFGYAEDVGTGSEVFLPDEPELPPDVAPPDLYGDARDAPAEPDNPVEIPADAGPLPDIELVLLDEADYQLGDTLGRLERLDAYEPLMHFGWTQAAWPEEQTEPVPLHLFGRPPTELDGTLMLYLGRYLHLVVDLQLQAPEDARATRRPASGFDGFVGNRDLAEPLPPRPVWYRIQEDRILRHGELRYFDHPKFGLLARVTRVAEEEPADEGELLGYPVQ